MRRFLEKETTLKKEKREIGIILLCAVASACIISLLTTIKPKVIIQTGNFRNYSAFRQYATAAKIEDYGIYVLGIICIIIIIVGFLKVAKSNNTLGLNFAIVAKHILLAALIWFCIVPLFSLSIERTIGAHRITCWCGPDYIQIDRRK